MADPAAINTPIDASSPAAAESSPSATPASRKPGAAAKRPARGQVVATPTKKRQKGKGVAARRAAAEDCTRRQDCGCVRCLVTMASVGTKPSPADCDRARDGLVVCDNKSTAADPKCSRCAVLSKPCPPCPEVATTAGVSLYEAYIAYHSEPFDEARQVLVDAQRGWNVVAAQHKITSEGLPGVSAASPRAVVDEASDLTLTPGQVVSMMGELRGAAADLRAAAEAFERATSQASQFINGLLSQRFQYQSVRTLLEVKSNQHRYQASGSMGSRCITCDRAFGSEDALEQHLRNSPVHAPSFDCDDCNRSFRSDNALQHHLSDSPAHAPSFDCETCDRSFGSEGALEQHLRDSPVHAPSSFDCETCGRSFGSEEAWTSTCATPTSVIRMQKPLWTPFLLFPNFRL
ncbi:hypothetical protein PG994_015225 [Apiospora phragmitis]|uniref:C2H2-type domain-containing protein n=1 Tax=Apiospora phragmitis TaxID=2905665 RepID=A0ABR1SQX4_9PEZI